MLWLLDIVGGRDAHTILGWATSASRDEAWLTANILAAQPTIPDPMITELVDAKATLRGKLITQPAAATAVVLPLIRTFETSSVATVIDALNSIVAPDGSLP